jgi:hypothetical protein
MAELSDPASQGGSAPLRAIFCTTGEKPDERVSSEPLPVAHLAALWRGGSGEPGAIGREHGAPRVTKDGVTVAREIELDNKFENMGA